jgi:hypothetical protein
VLSLDEVKRAFADEGLPLRARLDRSADVFALDSKNASVRPAFSVFVIPRRGTLQVTFNITEPSRYRLIRVRNVYVWYAPKGPTVTKVKAAVTRLKGT